jgi:hypothetical protein
MKYLSLINAYLGSMAMLWGETKVIYIIKKVMMNVDGHLSRGRTYTRYGLCEGWQKNKRSEQGDDE